MRVVALPSFRKYPCHSSGSPTKKPSGFTHRSLVIGITGDVHLTSGCSPDNSHLAPRDESPGAIEVWLTLFSVVFCFVFFFSFLVILYFVFASGLHKASGSCTLSAAAVTGNLACSLDMCELWTWQVGVCSLRSQRQERVGFVSLFAVDSFIFSAQIT